MESFRDKYGHATVGEAIEWNEIARWYCEHDVTTESDDI